MCGIAGIFLKPGAAVPAGLLAGFAASLAHRGPDGAGRFEARDAGLLQTRLAIIDLATGDQPIHDGPLTLIANGEIYNYLELKDALPARYVTKSDCEPPLKFFKRQADHYADVLRGMYAIAIHDAAFSTLTLSRDLFGIKPLYVAESEAGLLFASEPAALLAAGVPRTLRRQKLNELLNLQFSTGTATVFSGIDRIAPGETLTLRHTKPPARTHLAWAPSKPPPANDEEALARFDAVMSKSVDLHQRADVPYGMFLSGGIDSAVILAFMARLNASPVLAYTAGFDDASVADERDAAAVTAKAAGARHERVEISRADVWANLPEIVAAMDDPVADYAIIPTWFLARRAREDVKVILSGEGGDEFFAGYGRYRSAARWLFPKAMRARGVFDGLDVFRAPLTGWRDGIAAAETRGGSRLTAAQKTDIADWLPHDLLLKLDRCLMAHAVEGRTPFVDREVASFAFSLPDRMKIRNGQGKFLLRLWLARNFPAAQPFAKKQGFDVPIAAWIAAEAGRLGELVARAPIVAELAHPDRVKTLFAQADRKREGFAAWVLLFTALWHRRHVLNLPPAGDVFTTLEQT
jgi:asparagine synthase (glutamine-hydrolysing)